MHLGLVLGVFALIFVAELPDKTMIATLIMGSRSRPLLVWIGATAAFTFHAALAVLAGGLLALLPHAWVEGVTALLFAGGAAYLLLVSEEEEEEEGEEEVAAAPKGMRPIATAPSTSSRWPSSWARPLRWRQSLLSVPSAGACC